MKEPKPMQEVHEWRHKLYEENKHMSWEDQIEKSNRIAEETILKYGLNIKRPGKAA